ncbi:MAG: M1 family aminopeptidase [bacterium]
MVVVVVATLLLISGCSHTVSGSGRPASPVSSASGASTGGSSGPAACPSSYIAPDPPRPAIVLAFAVAADHKKVTGTETVYFTPDADITELVFRLTANTAPTFAGGTQIRVTKASADHGAGAARYENAGAARASQGGLLRLPFPAKVTSGTTVRADLEFTLTLGEQGFDRYGRIGAVAWFASAQPLLAWERGFGWHTEPMLQFTAESATSEAARTDLTVTAPATDVVQTSGAATPVSTTDGRRTWHAALYAARDVSVAAGPFVTTTVDVDGTRLQVGAMSQDQLAGVVSDARFALDGLIRRFGPFPFPTLSITLLPTRGGGIEYPSSILLLGSLRLVTVHEIAHQWFYAMVGDSQATHAWLDEAFATYAEQLTDSTAIDTAALNLPGRVDTATTAYGADGPRYYRTTYDKGAAALRTAREAAGADRFDAAIRCYVSAYAWTIADPADLARALSGLPAALSVLRRAGAL